MVFNTNNRTGLNVLPIVETKNFIIINGILYDKLNFNQLSKVPVDVVRTESYTYPLNFSQFSCNIDADGITRSIASEEDKLDRNFEWTFIQNSAIKINMKNYTYERYILSESVGNAPRIIYQDNDYIHIFGQYGLNTTNKIYKFNKNDKTIKSASTFSEPISIKKMTENKMSLFISSGGYIYDYAITLLPTETKSKYVTQNNSGVTKNYGGLSNLDKLGYGYYVSCYSNFIIDSFKPDFASDTLTKSTSLDVFNDTTGKVDLTKFNDLGITPRAASGKFTINDFGIEYSYTTLSVYVQNIKGKEFLIINATKDAFLQIFVFEFTSEDGKGITKLKLLDYKKFDIFNGYSYIPVFKLRDNKYIHFNKGRFISYSITESGTIVYKDLIQSSVEMFGVDTYGRIYQIINGKVEVFNEKLANSISLKYKKYTDSVFSFTGSPVSKTIRVETTNIYGDYVTSKVKLTIRGNATFSNNTKEIQLAVTNGRIETDITISDNTNIDISGEILYNNELIAE